MKKRVREMKDNSLVCRPQDMHPYECDPMDCYFKEEHILMELKIIRNKLSTL